MNTCFIFREGKLYSKCKIIDKVKHKVKTLHYNGIPTMFSQTSSFQYSTICALRNTSKAPSDDRRVSE
ncbi:hypothetical protein P5673_001233 [Acropora cervicornis]|uniref:Uncharacterized protein n=1 Tax=Acropora cervicornis TaxID=6130 RepID=A0AAD9R5U1_ACRCE|nr:hypothetical protein P5673_001233 [Acropora cervicornis]